MWDTHKASVIGIVLNGLNRGRIAGKMLSLLQNHFEIELCKLF